MFDCGAPMVRLGIGIELLGLIGGFGSRIEVVRRFRGRFHWFGCVKFSDSLRPVIGVSGRRCEQPAVSTQRGKNYTRKINGLCQQSKCAEVDSYDMIAERA
jgi:hypothetical protein